MFVAECPGIEWISPNGCYELHEVCEIPAYSELESNWVCLQGCIRIKVLCVFFLYVEYLLGRGIGVQIFEVMNWPEISYSVLLYSCSCALVLQENLSLKCFWLSCVHSVDWGQAIGCTCSSHPIFLDMLVLLMFGEKYKLWSSPSCSFLICAPKFRYIHAHFDTSLCIMYLCVILWLI
jgi:hypothetical protein